MNRHDKPLNGAEAQLQFLDGEYRVVRPGLFVVCAVTGARIALEELRYWSVDFQEAYASPSDSLARIVERGY